MQDTGKIFCPFCNRELPDSIVWCYHCGRDLHGMKFARGKNQTKDSLYRVVPDGLQFGIALGGEIKIHGLDRKRAESILRILNSIAAAEEAG